MSYVILSDRQRAPVPFNERPPRRKDSRGGPCPELVRRTLVAGMDGESARYPGTTNDTTIARQRTPWWPTPHYTPAGDSWVNWTEAGPVRPELSMRMTDYRVMEGTSNTRNILDPRSDVAETMPGYRSMPDGRIVQPQRPVRVGLHTDPKRFQLTTVQRYTNPDPKMRAPRQDRLRSGQYTGQSYSQTTRIQGG